MALALLAAIVGADAASSHVTLVALLVVVPLVAALGCTPPAVLAFGVAALAATIVMGAVDDLLGSERNVVALAVVVTGGALAVVAARARATASELRDVEKLAFDRIALLDRSSRLIAGPMDFNARLRELTRLVVPDVADLAMIDLLTADGRLGGAIASAADPAIAALVERTRASSPIDPSGEHPVAVALRTGEPQLRGAMADEELQRYAASPEHLEMMRRLAYRSAVVVPLLARGRTLGVLSVLRLGNPRSFDATDTSLLSDLASRAAMAVDNARLFEEREAAEAQLATIIATLAEAVTIVNREGELVYVNEAAAELFGYGSAEEAMRVPVAQMGAAYELLDEAGAPLDRSRLPGSRVLAGAEPEPVTFKRRHVETGEERWLTVKASSVPDVTTGEPSLAVNVIEDVTAQRRAHEASAFLAEASKLLASTLDFESALRAVAEASVPQIADWCAIDLVDEEGEVVPVALANADPGQAPVAAELRESYPPGPGVMTGAARVRRTGRPKLHAEFDPALVEASAVDARHLELLRALNVTSALSVPLTTGEEILGTITFVTTGGSRRLGEADRELAEELGRRAGVAVEHARVQRERSTIAATLQRSLLPPRLPIVPGVELAARFRAAGEANQVGGDFYDLFAVAGGWMVVIGDVTGKGPTAAAATALARYTIRTAALYEPRPERVMQRLNEVLLADGDATQMCTAVCLMLTPAQDGGPVRADFLCAGHPPPYLLHGPGRLEELCRPGPLLGAFDDATWEATTIELSPGAALVLYTDGVTDASSAEGRFGQERLEDVLRAAAGADAGTIAEALDGSLLAFQQGPQRDDVALLVLRATVPGHAPETTVIAGSATTAP